MIFKVLGTEITLPTTTGTATSFSEARRVRLANTSTNNREITIVSTQSGDVVGKFTLLPTGSNTGGNTVIIDKEYSECVFASGGSVLGVKVGFVGY